MQFSPPQSSSFSSCCSCPSKLWRPSSRSELILHLLTFSPICPAKLHSGLPCLGAEGGPCRLGAHLPSSCPHPQRRAATGPPTTPQLYPGLTLGTRRQTQGISSACLPRTPGHLLSNPAPSLPTCWCSALPTQGHPAGYQATERHRARCRVKACPAISLPPLSLSFPQSLQYPDTLLSENRPLSLCSLRALPMLSSVTLQIANQSMMPSYENRLWLQEVSAPGPLGLSGQPPAGCPLGSHWAFVFSGTPSWPALCIPAHLSLQLRDIQSLGRLSRPPSHILDILFSAPPHTHTPTTLTWNYQGVSS